MKWSRVPNGKVEHVRLELVTDVKHILEAAGDERGCSLILGPEQRICCRGYFHVDTLCIAKSACVSFSFHPEVSPLI
jgi:hypothetical protein